MARKGMCGLSISAVFLLAVRLFAAGCGGEGPGTIEGTVGDRTTQTQIVGATVSVVGTDLQAITDLRGAYAIGGVPEGPTRVRADTGAHWAQTVEVNVPSDSSVVVDFWLDATTPESAQGIIEGGNTSVGGAIDSFQTTVEQPEAGFGTAYTASQADLAAARDVFEEVVEAYPDNQEANLGIGVVQLMMLLGDTNEDFGVEGMMAGGAVMGGPAAMMSRRWFPGKLISRLRNRQGEPTITDFQNHLESQVIPELEEIIGHLESVTDEGIQVQVPPDPDPENPDNYRIVDYGDVLLLRAIVYQVLDLAHSAVVYHLDPGTFYDAGPMPPDLDTDPDDWILTPAEFLPPDPFLTLRSNGVSHSREALDAERHAMSSLVAAIDFMLAEYTAGTQNHEVIPVGTGPEQADPADLERMRAVVEVFIRVLEGETTVSNTEFDPAATPVVEITVNLPAFANNPPADLKDLVPDLTYEQDPISEEYFVSGIGALPDPTFAGLLPEGVPVTTVAALLKK